VPKTILLMLFSPLFLFQCCALNNKLGETSREAPQQLILHCNFSDFTQARIEHIIDEIRQPFFVRTISGQIISSINEGEWAEDSPVLFEIRGIDKENRIMSAHADKYGIFQIASVPEGQYCFKATAEGWHSVMGVIIVTKKADPKNRIVFQMNLGT
jgi:hypothetical protein